jgi:hypothetical protein
MNLSTTMCLSAPRSSSAAADYLVTEDKDLLVLESYKGSRILQPAGFIAMLEGDSTLLGELGLDTTSTHQLESNAATLFESTEALRSRSNFSDPSVFLSMLD